MTTIVQFENVGLRYGPGAEAMPEALISEALVDVSFSLQAGASYFLTGPSGAGKTSLLRLLCLAQRPSRGTVRLFGEDMVTIPRHQLPARRRRIGVVHQDARLIPHLSVAGNVALPLRIAGQGGAGQGGADIDTRVTETLDRVGLADRAAAAPMTLSGGEQQRVAIARAVVGRPDLLIADEPTGNVDPATADRLMHLFAALGRHGTTVVVATHDSRLFTRLPDARMIRLSEGRLRDPAIMPRPPVPA